ncbi:MAG: hypothetical protein GF320_07125 [Armatimonadia bacterium]|nr:hypothetical protein [Armatimonadia bacterium]
MVRTLLTLLAFGATLGACQATPIVPVIASDWWQVAGDPDIGKYTTDHQQPVDFGTWQASDGTWQLWSCIRGTACGGTGRLFHGWQGPSLPATDWAPLGITMQADTSLGETKGGLQAPHVIVIDGIYHMFYGDWERICLATSADGKRFQRVLGADGELGLFTEGLGTNTRDPMVLPIDGVHHCYYTAFPDGEGAVFCRTSTDLVEWSESVRVAFGGQAGTNPWAAECPHVVYHEPSDQYVLFRTQRYGENARTSVYCSPDPLDFGIHDDRYFVGTLPVAAPEIVLHEGEWYIASLMPSLKGIMMARLEWEPAPKRGDAVLDLTDPLHRARWSLTHGHIEPRFTQSTRRPFGNPLEYFIGTAESVRGGPDDAQRGVLLSPVFEIRADRYMLYVSGGRDEEALYVALEDASTGEELFRFTGRDYNGLRPELLDTADLIGRHARVRVVDRRTDGWGHINFGGLFEAE